MAQSYPHSAGTGGPDFSVPADACDCHMHVFDDAYPAVAGAPLLHARASLADYRRIQARLGLRRHVLVQPSTYGLDNSLMLKTLDEAGRSARGIAVVDANVADEALADMAGRGVTGVRFNLVQKGSTRIDMLEAVAARIRPFGMHVQVHMPPRDLIAAQETLLRLPVPVVLDHFARLGAVAADDQAAGAARQAALRLLDGGNCWIKLSGAYMVGRPPDYDDLGELAREWLARAPGRLVWATDWPHATEARKPDGGDLLSALGRWVESPDDRVRILVSNPAALYGFAPGD